MEDIYKEVYFNQFCKTCEHKDLPEDEDPCHDCLHESANLYSHRPVYWKEKE